MNHVFKSYHDKFVVVFIDGILVYSSSKAKHKEHLRIFFEYLRGKELYTKLKKCEFWLAITAFLRNVVSKDEISMDPAKIETMVDWTQPKNI